MTEIAVPLDDTVREVHKRLRDAGVAPPQVLFFLATGLGPLPERLREPLEVPLDEVPGVPEPWRRETLHTGELGRLSAWILEDVSGEPLGLAPERSWVRGFPVWLAAAAGASVCVHASAGSALPAEATGERPGRVPLEPGRIALVRDHLNLSGSTPLLGLGPSSLGPLFPDLSSLHHLGLRRAALERAEKLGIPAAEAIAACTAGPALDTPAERRMLARAGADVAVQGLAVPLVAAGHAGLAVLSFVVVTDASDGPADVADLVEAAGETEPRLHELFAALSEDLERAVAVLEGGGS